MDYRIGIDVMTTETACLSSIWADGRNGRRISRRARPPGDYKELAPADGA
jgi:aconitate hydratase